MDFSKQITEMQQKKAGLMAKAEQAIKDGDTATLCGLNDQIEDLTNRITATQKLKDNAESSAEPEKGVPKQKNKKDMPFMSLGEQLKSVMMAAKGTPDNRLGAVNAAQGLSTSVGSDGGYAIQEDFAGVILETAVSSGEILSRVDSYTSSAAANAVRFMTTDESDLSKGVYGGVQAYWAAEATSVLNSKPKFIETKIDLEKMMALVFITDEALEDMPFMSGLLNNAMAEAANRLLEGSVIDGDGVGKPLGILNSKSLVTVKKESEQTEKLKYANIVRMYGRMLPAYKKDAVWVIHPDLAEELAFLNLPVGTGGVPVYLPPSGASGAPYATLLGKPIIESDHMAAAGSLGDIGLFNLKQYMLLKKGTVKQDMSIHVEFLTGQNCFRLQLRAGGAPKGNKPVKLKNSSVLRSAFVVLEDRK